MTHNETILKTDFDMFDWTFNAILSAERFRKIANTLYREMLHNFKNTTMEGLPSLLFISYENLTNPETRIDALESLASFLHINRNVTRERLECAYILSSKVILIYVFNYHF